MANFAVHAHCDCDFEQLSFGCFLMQHAISRIASSLQAQAARSAKTHAIDPARYIRPTANGLGYEPTPFKSIVHTFWWMLGMESSPM